MRGSAIAHSDRGSNYTSRDYAELLDELGLSQSPGRTGICYDNAAAESFQFTLTYARPLFGCANRVLSRRGPSFGLNAAALCDRLPS